VKKHAFCPEVYKWQFKNRSIVCGWCLQDKRTVLSIINCSTELQNVTFKIKAGLVRFVVKRQVLKGQELFLNYGSHAGHIRCRQLIDRQLEKC
jgi:hypothetical protein